MLEPVKIPQNVYVEDRIIGPVTLKQLIICGLGAGFSYAIYSTAAKMGHLGIPLTIMLWMPAAVAAAFAFVKINDLSLFNIVLLLIEHGNKPTQRVWSPHAGISINVVTRQAQEADVSKKLSENAAKLMELTTQMEKRQQELATLANQTPAAAELEIPATAEISPAAEISPRLKQAQQAMEEKVTAPVTPSRIQAQGLDPSRSIDGISGGLQAFEHIFKNP